MKPWNTVISPWLFIRRPFPKIYIFLGKMLNNIREVCEGKGYLEQFLGCYYMSAEIFNNI
jgi:hypothetical protein